MKIEFCLPIHNEEKILKENTLKLLTYLDKQEHPWNWEIILVINGSSDSSYVLGQKLEQEFPGKIKAVNYPSPGRGQALKKYFSSSQADILLYMDIDLAVSLDNIAPTLKALIEEGYSLAIGSRLLAESKIERSFIRELSSQTYNFLSRLILGHHISDMQCGFKAIKKELFEKIKDKLLDDKWFFDTEMIVFAKKFGGKIKEIPVDWQENRYDERKSKVKLIRDSLRFIKNLIKLRLRLAKTKNSPN